MEMKVGMSLHQPFIHCFAINCITIVILIVFDCGQQSIASLEDPIAEMINCFWRIQESQGFAVIEGFIVNVCDGWRKKACLY